MNDPATGSALALAVIGWAMYLRERGRSRDYLTDLMQLVHDHDLDRSDLRRSLDWHEVRVGVARKNRLRWQAQEVESDE